MNPHFMARKLFLFLFFFPLFLQAQDTATVATLLLQNEEAINSKGLDFSPTFYEDGIVFISTNAPDNVRKITDDKLKLPAMSILRSRRDSTGKLGAPVLFAKEISSRFHEGPVCFDRTAEKVYFSSNVTVKGREKLARDGEQKMRLFISEKKGEGWTEPTSLPFNIGEWDDCHPAISIDGDKLFFASNRPGGQGGMDLYVAFRLGDAWSEPVNLGDKINTPGHEVFPFLHADNTLYFASDKHETIGGFDLFYTIPEDAGWAKPVNLGTPFNTPSDDFGLIVDLDKKNGYFSSNGNGGIGADDIFSFSVNDGNLDDYLFQHKRLPAGDFSVLLNVQNQDSQMIENAVVRILNLNENNVIGRDEEGNLITLQSIDGQDIMKVVPADNGITGTTDAAGKFAAKLSPGNYVILISKDGYQTKQITHQVMKSGQEFTAVLEKAEGKVHWNATLFNDLTNTPLAGATLILTNEATGKKDTITTDAAGNVNYYVEKNANYAVDIYQNGKLMGKTKMNTTGWELGETGKQGEMNLNISFSPLAAGTKITLPNIYYNYNDATLRPESKKDLKLVINLMQQYSGIVLELASHTDSRGTDQYNLALSQKRADNVGKYLSENGVPISRLKPTGYGEKQPRNRCKDGVDCNEKEHARNRRTEVKVLAGADGAVVKQVDGSLGLGKSTRVNQAPGNVQMNSNEKMNFYIVSGSFLMKTRAEAQTEKLKGMGYTETKVIQFPGSTFYSVVAKQTSDRSEALAISSDLKSKENMKNFIKPMPK